jgi:RNA polymerase sigma factor (TIGR02999 family)
MAAARMRSEPGQTLQPTALVHEVYLRLFQGNPAFHNRAHFFTAAGEAMRRILVERARRMSRVKRGSGKPLLDVSGLSEVLAGPSVDPADVLAAHEAIRKLEEFDPRAADIVKLRCFVGMSVAEAADALQISPRTLSRDWQSARAWLRQELACPGEEGSADEGAPRS